MTVDEGVEENKDKQKSVLVGIRINGNSRELLNWALAKVAEPGDRVIAVHVCQDSDPHVKVNYSATLCSLDGYLAVYEGFCNVKKINLVGQISQGNSIRKVLVREAKLCAATALVVGIGKCNALGGSLSLARYCAKMLPPTTAVLTIHKGKVVFQKNATKQLSGLTGDPRPSFRSSSLHHTIGKDSKVMNPSHKESPEIEFSKVSEVENLSPQIVHNSEDSGRDLKEITSKQDLPLTGKDDVTKFDEAETGKLSSSTFYSTVGLESVEEVEREHYPLALEQMDKVSRSSFSLLIRKLPESRPGWPLLRRRASSEIPELSRDTEARKLSVVQWVMKLPNRTLSFTPQSHIGLAPYRREIHESGEKSTRSCLSAWFDLPRELETLITTSSTNCRVFSRKEIQSSMISPENLIGKGGYSQVYKGCLPNGQPVAIKRSQSSKRAWKDFLLEVDIVTSLQHKHITPLIGVCVEGNDLISIYKFLSRGSLEENLHGKGDKSVLPWEVRFKVAVGVGEALTYLHSICSRPIIHRDVKSSNILLSDEFEPQLSDFGLALLAPTTSAYVTYSDVVGTFGYLAPEYFMYGKVSDKLDVYSYGVVLLELLSGRKPINAESPKGQESLVMWATPKLESGEAMDLLDPNLAGEFDKKQMRQMVLAATLCITRTTQHRPQMSQILKLLQGVEDVVEWAESEVNVPKETDHQDEEAYPVPSVPYHHIDLALRDADDDATSVSSTEHNHHHSLEDYFRGRWSRSSSSFD